jgi:hypothetical protein
MQQRGIIGAALLVAVIAGVTIALTLGGDDDPAEDASATPAPSQDEMAAGEVVQVFVEALGTGNADALYAIQQDAYKQVCSREAFQVIADRLVTQPLEGPARISVQGDRA